MNGTLARKLSVAIAALALSSGLAAGEQASQALSWVVRVRDTQPGWVEVTARSAKAGVARQRVALDATPGR